MNVQHFTGRGRVCQDFKTSLGYIMTFEVSLGYIRPYCNGKNKMLYRNAVAEILQVSKR